MKLCGTRNAKQKVELSEALLNPSADFGGLFVPVKFPKFDENFFKNGLNLSYKELALEIIDAFKFDISREIFASALDCYDEFDDPHCPVKISKIGEKLYLNELYHGPTRAFKDMALQPFGKILDTLASARGEKYLVMCATSGDTGPATLASFENAKNVRVVCIYPASGTSALQKLQMTSVSAPNLKTIGINGNFDDAQNALKSLLSDSDFRSNLNAHGLNLSAANSVNFGRILFQIIYYFYEYLYLLRTGAIEFGEKFDVIIPSGNFGNALGAYYAKKMGVKIKKIKIASNANSVLTEFFNRGRYNLKERELIKTISPAMDILISSNIERLLFDKFGDKKCKKMMDNLKKHREYSVNLDKFNEFEAEFCTDFECANFIKKSAENGKLIDPHTATCLKFQPKKRVCIIASTAHWIKFTPSMIGSIKGAQINIQNQNDEKEQMIALADEFNEKIPQNITKLFDANQIHKDVVQKDELKAKILDWISK